MRAKTLFQSLGFHEVSSFRCGDSRRFGNDWNSGSSVYQKLDPSTNAARSFGQSRCFHKGYVDDETSEIKTVIPFALQKILIVDDNPTDTLLLEKALIKSGIQNIETARTTAQAIDKIQDAFLDSRPLPNLIFAGLTFNAFSGLSEMVLWLKQNPIFKKIPVIVLSGAHNPKEKTKALVTGVNEYHEKPLGQNLTALVQCIIGTYLFPGIPAPSHSPPVLSPDSPPNIVQEITKRALELRKNRKEFAKDLGISPKTLWNWETNRKKPSAALEARIRRMLLGSKIENT